MEEKKEPLSSLRDDLDVRVFTKEGSKAKEKRECERRESGSTPKSKFTNEAS